MYKQENLPLTTPFNNIALALSGGGFRAASFSLGIMSYLDHVKFPGDGEQRSLLSNVHFISSASGGTITNLVYSMFLKQGKSFKEAYAFLLEKMEGESLLNLVLEKLNNEREWEPAGTGKSRNLINAFAKVYDEQLFGGETFEIFANQENTQHSVCFNTTDFYRGLSFRFQTDGNKKTFEYTGNRYIHFDKNQQAYKKIKLADILAASSCFPAGFEPIIFPDDFVYSSSLTGKTLTKTDLKEAIILEEYDSSEKVLAEPLAFMDGGITDNQGLMSLMYADDRQRGGNQPFDLIITGDVTSHFMDPYKPVDEKKAEGWRGETINSIIAKINQKAKMIDTWFGVSIILFFLSIGLVVLNQLTWKEPWLIYGALVLSGVSIAVAIILGYIRHLKKSNPILRTILNDSPTPGINKVLENLNLRNTFSAGIVNKLLAYLGETKLSVLELMVKARAASVLVMTMDVNLKHTRRLIYQLFFENEAWTDRRLYNVTFELSSFNSDNRWIRINKKLSWKATDDDKKTLLDVTSEILQIADDARTMGTTLWFGEEDSEKKKLKKLVACGQFTTCMNMIEYVLSLERRVESKELELRDAELTKLAVVKKQLLEDWASFKNNPYFLY